MSSFLKSTTVYCLGWMFLMIPSINGGEAPKLKLYQDAPKFEAPDDTGKIWKSSEHVGKKYVVVYFYPADMTGGCTKQACGFRDNLGELEKHDIEVVGVSGDSVRNHQLFKKVHKLNFTLLADTNGALAKKFGVPTGEGGSIERTIDGKSETLTRGVTSSRWTFLINKQGRIGWHDSEVNAAEDYKKVLSVVQELESLDGREPSFWNLDLPKQKGSRWLMHDSRRPLPEVVSPGKAASAAPSDAIVLFDGTDLSQWRTESGKAPRWYVRDGYMELNPNHHENILSKQEFDDCQLHIEWRTPTPPQKNGQTRGNSGVFLMNRYEVQIVDSYQNPTYADGTAASLYGMQPPLVNACRPPGEWQTYDIIFRAPRFQGEKLVEPARVTVIHNGVLVQYESEFHGRTAFRSTPVYEAHGPGPIYIQDHGDRQAMRFRNIWVRPLDFSPKQ